MSSKYFSHSTNRTPEQRRQVRKYVEEQPVSGTASGQEQLVPLDVNSTKPKNLNIDEYQDINPVQAVGVVGIMGKTIWGIVIGALTLVGLVIGAIVFFSDITSKITENRVNIQTTNTLIQKQEEYVNDKIDTINTNLTDKINDLKEEFKELKK